MVGKHMSICLNINGEERTFQGDPLTPLLDVLRDEFFLTGAKSVCREGFCGACTVQIDDVPIMSCLRPVALVEGANVLTIEGLGIEGELSPVQQAFEDFDAVQCGMCFPGMVMSLTSFLKRSPDATRGEMKSALSGNICRCTGYERIIDAALSLTSRCEHVEQAQ
jgi:carbon-monoxide dehydrogenase small subunit